MGDGVYTDLKGVYRRDTAAVENESEYEFIRIASFSKDSTYASIVDATPKNIQVNPGAIDVMYHLL